MNRYYSDKNVTNITVVLDIHASSGGDSISGKPL